MENNQLFKHISMDTNEFSNVYFKLKPKNIGIIYTLHFPPVQWRASAVSFLRHFTLGVDAFITQTKSSVVTSRMKWQLTVNEFPKANNFINEGSCQLPLVSALARGL